MNFLALLLLAQVTPLNLNEQPPKRFSCDGGIECHKSGSTLYITGSGAGAPTGKVAEAYMADASITAQAFDHDPAACPGGQFVTDQSAGGVLTCATPSGGGKVAEAYMADASITAQVAGWAYAADASYAAQIATVAQTAYSADASYSATLLNGVPDCANATTGKLLYTLGTNTWSCGTDQTGGGGAGSGVSFEQQVTLTAAGFFQQAVSLAATTATSKFVCRPFGTDDAGLTTEAISIANLQVTVSDLSAGVGLNINVFNPYGLEGIVTIHCTTGG